MLWENLLGHLSPADALKKACDDFGISVDEAIAEKVLEVNVRTYLRSIPNDRLKASQYADYLAATFSPKAVPSWIPAMLADNSRGPTLTEDQLLQLDRRQNSRCALCGVFLNSASQPHIDHIIPVALRGESTISNFQLLCAKCNIGKSKLLGWIMGAPFLSEGRGEATIKQRFCALARAQGQCQVDGCDADSSTSELHVVPRVPPAKGGRWIFDNMMVMCHDDFVEHEKAALREARMALRSSAYLRR